MAKILVIDNSVAITAVNLVLDGKFRSLPTSPQRAAFRQTLRLEEIKRQAGEGVTGSFAGWIGGGP